MKNIYLRIAFLLLTITQVGAVESQTTIDVDQLKQLKKKSIIDYSGNISANSIFHSGNGDANRDPFTYYLNGEFNLSIAGVVDLPFSFYISNAGRGYNYPTMPNRLSLNPKYKWINGYIGDVSMNFSSYTLNNRQFRGAGVELTPKGKFKIAAMAGRLQQDVAYDEGNQTAEPAYKRYGYGTKIGFEKTKYRLGLILFGAKDYLNSSLSAVAADSLNVFPQKNLVVSVNGSYMPSKNYEFNAEYSTSALTKDSRDSTSSEFEGNNFLKNVFAVKSSTTFYSAVKVSMNYKFKSSSVGVGYEKVDPGYQTMGGYFFNNDLENITVNFAQPFFKSKGNITGNVGYQHDDLKHTKMGSTSRTVGSINVTFAASKKLFFMAGYSNFKTFMYIKPQFQDLSQLSQFQYITMQDYSQISQNALFSVNYNISQTEKKTQSVNLNCSFFDAADKQGGVVRFGSASQLYNVVTSYSVLYVPKSIGITASMTGTYNAIGKDEFVTFGPTISVSAKLFKKLSSNFVTSYNQSVSGGLIQQSVLNTRFNVGYKLKDKHNLNLSVLSQFSNLQLAEKKNDQVVTLGYNYSF